MKTIPNNLKECRIACDLSQVAVSKKLGLKSSDRISRWEKGQMYPHVVNLLKLSIIYEKKSEELYPELIASFRREIQT